MKNHNKYTYLEFNTKSTKKKLNPIENLNKRKNRHAQYRNNYYNQILIEIFE